MHDVFNQQPMARTRQDGLTSGLPPGFPNKHFDRVAGSRLYTSIRAHRLAGGGVRRISERAPKRPFCMQASATSRLDPVRHHQAGQLVLLAIPCRGENPFRLPMSCP